VNAQVQKLLDTKKANLAQETPVVEAKENIEFDDFAKIDIRTGTIIEENKKTSKTCS